MATNGIVKSGFVAIIGLPNAGKSSFLNAVLDENIAITSKKPQTTRKNFKGIYNDEESQIVFVDTPGLHDIRNKLDDYMSKNINKSIVDTDIIIFIIDVMTYEADNFEKIINLISKSKVKKILLINKCDLIDVDSGKLIQQVLSKFRDKDGIDKTFFDKIFYISALKKTNIKDIIKYLKDNLPTGYRYYDSENLTDEPVKQIVADIIRQQCLYKLDKEIPHGITTVVESMKKSKNKCMNINALIICEKESHKGIIIGKFGSMIKNIGTGSRIAIEKFIKCKVNLKLNVLVKEHWRDINTQLINLGFDSKKI